MTTTRQMIELAVEHKLTTYKALSEAIGRNHAYIQQFMKRNVDAELPRSADDKIRAILQIKFENAKTEAAISASTPSAISASVRFDVRRSPQARTPLHYVYDTVLQIEVFHWHGDTGKTKCKAVADALNALKHEVD